ncbi:hypothetical protein [Parasitella parasitica]|uniref:MI domain-containing protein n=1 Tax=Parasitella parasitica TaxID=35722 RepID=A0A0B7N1B1_9FUNG|nr:hypothetical protein [Parasitella parasitica]
MNRSSHSTEQRANKVPNYAQAAAKSQQQQPQQTRGHQPQQSTTSNLKQAPYSKNGGPAYSKTTGGSNNSQQSYHGQANSYTNNKKDSIYGNRKEAPVQLPMAPPTESAPIQFGSINQPSTAPLSATPASTQQISITKTPADAQSGRSPAVKDTNHHRPPANNSHQTRHSPQQQQKEIPRSPRNTSDGRLFTQPYAPRRDFNQGDQYSNNRYNNNNYNNSNNNSSYRNNGYRPPPPHQHSPNPPYHHQHHQHHYHQFSPSPHQQQQNLPPSPMSHRASPNMNTYNAKKTNNNSNNSSSSISPHIPHSSPQQNFQMANASWSSFYPHYPVAVSSYNMPAATRPPIIPPPNSRKPIAIIDPNTGAALNTSPMSLISSPSNSLPSQPHKEEKHLDFVKPPHASKAVVIVDPAIRDRELREKREREEAEEEALRKAEEDKKEAERKAIEEKERLEREKVEAETREVERKKEADRLEAERLENERKEEEVKRKEAERVRLAEEASAIAAAVLEKQKQQDELRRRAEEEKESKRVISELEAERKRQEEVSAQKVGRVPSRLEIPVNPLTHSPVSSPAAVDVSRPIKVIQDFGAIQYPAGINPPEAQDGKKHVYSIDFLLQFQQLCLDTNEDLSAINFKEIESSSSSRSGSAMHQSSDRGRGGPRTPGASNNMTGDNIFKMNSRDGRMEMGKFNMGRPLTNRNNSTHIERQGSHNTSRGGSTMRGGRGGGSGMKIIRNPAILNQQGAPTIPVEQVAPLEKSDNRWVPTVNSQLAQAPAEGELMSQEFITRKVNALLNKLTLEKFDSISAQIFDYARQSTEENDGRSLRTVMSLTFEKACDEPAFASMWAKLCRSMYDAMTDDIKDTNLLVDEKPSSGTSLFRKYLFNRCQVEFEKGWKVNMPKVDEADNLMTEEYYKAAKAKRQGLGLIQFIGEMYKLEMLSTKIMVQCMKRLCEDPSNAGDEEVESLCKLITTIGKVLDKAQKTHEVLNAVTATMKDNMMKSPNLTSRVKFMIQDVIDLRKDKWVPRLADKQAGPTTIAKIHELAEKDKEEKEAAAIKRNNSSRGQYIPNNNNQYNSNQYNNSRSGPYRTGKDNSSYYFNNNASNTNNANNGSNSSIGANSNSNNNSHSGDGWNTVANNANSKGRTADLSNFGKTDRSRSRSNILGPSNSPFASLNRSKAPVSSDTKNTDGRSSPATNMFSALLNDGEKQGERKKLVLAPKSTDKALPKLTNQEIKRKSKNILEEYFSIRDKKELFECVKELDDSDYLVVFIGEMLTAVERKAKDVDDMCKVIEYLNSENLLSKNLYIKAFKQFMEGFDDLTIDVPQAPKYVAQLLSASSVSPAEIDGDHYDALQKAYKTLVESN